MPSIQHNSQLSSTEHLAIIRAKDGNLSDNKEYEIKMRNGSWSPIDKTTISQMLAKHYHILWNPVGFIQYGEPNRKVR